jgi:hypothetical protein
MSSPCALTCSDGHLIARSARLACGQADNLADRTGCGLQNETWRGLECAGKTGEE